MPQLCVGWTNSSVQPDGLTSTHRDKTGGMESRRREGTSLWPGHMSETGPPVSNEANDVSTETDKKQLVEEDCDSEEAGCDNSGSSDSSESEDASSSCSDSSSSNDDSTDSNDDSSSSNDDSTDSNDDSTDSNDDSTDSNDDSTDSNDDSTDSNDDSTDSNDESTDSNEPNSSEDCNSSGSSDSVESFCQNDDSGSGHSKGMSTLGLPVDSSRLTNSKSLKMSRLFNSSLPPPCQGPQALDAINIFYSQFLQENRLVISDRVTRVRTMTGRRTDADGGPVLEGTLLEPCQATGGSSGGDGSKECQDHGSRSEATPECNTTPGNMNNGIYTNSETNTYESVEGPLETESALKVTSPDTNDESGKKKNCDVQLDNVCVFNSMASEGTECGRSSVLSEALRSEHLERFHHDHQSRDQVEDVVCGSNEAVGAPQDEGTLNDMPPDGVDGNRSGGSDGFPLHVDHRNAADDIGEDMASTDACTEVNTSSAAGEQIPEHPTTVYEAHRRANITSDSDSLPDVISCSRDLAQNGLRFFNPVLSDEACERVRGDIIYLVPSQTRRTRSSTSDVGHGSHGWHSSNENIVQLNSSIHWTCQQLSLEDLPANSSTAAGRASTTAGWALREQDLRLKCRGEVENIEDEFLYYEEDLLNSLEDNTPSNTDVVNISGCTDRPRDDQDSDYNFLGDDGCEVDYDPPCDDGRDVDYVPSCGEGRDVVYVPPRVDGREVDYVLPCTDERDVDYVPPCDDRQDVASVSPCDDGQDVAYVPLCGDGRNGDCVLPSRDAAERSRGHDEIKDGHDEIIYCTAKDSKDSGMGWSPPERIIIGSPGTPEQRSDRPMETPERRTIGSPAQSPHRASAALGSARQGCAGVNGESVSYQTRSSEMRDDSGTADSEVSSSESEGTNSLGESEESNSEESTASDGSSEGESDDSSSDNESENKSKSCKYEIHDRNVYEMNTRDSEFTNVSFHAETVHTSDSYHNRNKAVNGPNLTATIVEESCSNAIVSIGDGDGEEKDIVDITETAGNEENVKNVLHSNEINEEGTCGGEREPEDPLRQGFVCIDVVKCEVKNENRPLYDKEYGKDICNLFSQTNTELDLDRVNEVSGVRQSLSPEATAFNDEAAGHPNIKSQANNNRSSYRLQISSNSSDSNVIEKGRDEMERLTSKQLSGSSDDQNTSPTEPRGSLSQDQSRHPSDRDYITAPADLRSPLSLDQAVFPSDENIKSPATDAPSSDEEQNDGSCESDPTSSSASNSSTHCNSSPSSDEEQDDGTCESDPTSSSASNSSTHCNSSPSSDEEQDDGTCESDPNSSSVSKRRASNSSTHCDRRPSSGEGEEHQRKLGEDEMRTRNLIALRQSRDSEEESSRMTGGDDMDNTCEAMSSLMENRDDEDDTCKAECFSMVNGDGDDLLDYTSEHRGQERAQDHKMDVDNFQFVVQHSLFGGLNKRGYLAKENELSVLATLGGSVCEVRCAGCRKVLKASVYSHLSRSKKCQASYDMERIKEEHFETMRQRKRRQSCELKRKKRNLLNNCEELALSYKEDEKEKCFGCNKKFLLILTHLKYSASCREKYDFEAMLESHKKILEKNRAESKKKFAEGKREAITLKCKGDPRLKKCEGCGKMFMIHLLNHLHKSLSCQQVYGGKEGVRAMAKENRREKHIAYNRQKYIEKRDEIREHSRQYHHAHTEDTQRRKKNCLEKNQGKIYERNLENFQMSKARKIENVLRRKAGNFEQRDEMNSAEMNKKEKAPGTGVLVQNSERQRGMSEAEIESGNSATADMPNEHENVGHSLPKISRMCSVVDNTPAGEPSSLQDSLVLDVSVDHSPARTGTGGSVFLSDLVTPEEPCFCCGKELRSSLYSHLSRSKRCQQHYDVGLVREQHFGMMKQRKRLQNLFYRRRNDKRYSFGAENCMETIDEDCKEKAAKHRKKGEDTIGGAQSKVDTKQTCLGCNKPFHVILSHLSSSASCREHYDVEGMRKRQRRQQRKRESELRRQQRSLAKEGKTNVNKCQACGLQFLISLVNHLQRSETCQEMYGGREAVLAMAKEERRKKNIALARRRFNEKRELVREEGRLYYRKHRLAVIMKSKEYWQKNKEKILERRRKYRQRLRDQKKIQEETINKGSLYLGLETAVVNRPKEIVADSTLSVVDVFEGDESSQSGCGEISKSVSWPDVAKVKKKLARFAFNAAACASKDSNILRREGEPSNEEHSRNFLELISCPVAVKQQSATVGLGLEAAGSKECSKLMKHERYASVTLEDDHPKVSPKDNSLSCFGPEKIEDRASGKLIVAKSESHRTKGSSECNKENIASGGNLYADPITIDNSCSASVPNTAKVKSLKRKWTGGNFSIGPIIREDSCCASVPKTVKVKPLKRRRVGGNSASHLMRLTALDINGTRETNKNSISG